MRFAAHAVIYFLFFVAWWPRNLGVLVRGVSSLAQDRGYWRLATWLFRWQQWLEGLASATVLVVAHPDKRARLLSMSMRSSALIAVNDEYAQLCLRCLAAYSDFAWSPAGVAALLSRSAPAQIRDEVRGSIREALEVWATHNEGVFDLEHS